MNELELDVRESEGGTVLRLPMRPTRQSRASGVLPLVFGLFFGGVPLIGLLLTWFSPEAPIWSKFLVTLFISPFVAVGLAAVVTGLYAISNGTTLRVDRRRLHATERFGPFRWTWRHDLDRLGALSVAVRPMKWRRASRRATRGQDEDGGSHWLRLESLDGDDVWIASGYPAEFLTEVGAALNDARGEGGEVIPIEAREPEPEEEDAGDEPLDQDDLDAPSDLHSYVDGDDWVLDVPPAGLIRGGRGLFSFSIFWNGFMVVFTGGFLWISSSQGGSTGDTAVFVAFISLFWAIGIGLALSAWNMGKRRAVMRAGPSGLTIERRGPFGSKRIAIERGDVRAVRVGASSMEVNDVPIQELQIDRHRGKRIGMLSQRPEEQLEWIARALRARLGLEGE